MRKLTKQEVYHINSIQGINLKKDYIQNLVLTEWVKIQKGCLVAFTSFGKNYLINKILHLFNIKKPDYKVLIIVPRDFLKESIEADIQKFGFKNIEVAIVNSLANRLVKKDTTEYYDLVICDELHNLCGEFSLYFSQVIPRLGYKYFFGCSATLEKEHIKYLKNNDLEVFFDIPIEDGYKCSLVPDYNIWNIPVQMTDSEKIQYVKIQNEYHSLVAKFSTYDVDNPTRAITSCLGTKNAKIKYEGIEATSIEHATRIAEVLEKTPGQVIGLAMLWRGIQTKRRVFLNNCVNSVTMTSKLIKKLDDQVLVFCASIDIANKLYKQTPNSGVYHSKISDKKRTAFKEDFINGKLKVLFVCNSMKEGFSYNKLKYVIRQGFNSKSLDLVQIVGRILRFDKNNPTKEAHLFHIYVEDFIDMFGNTQKSQQKKWLQSGLKGKNFVSWIDSIEEINL